MSLIVTVCLVLFTKSSSLVMVWRENNYLRVAIHLYDEYQIKKRHNPTWNTLALSAFFKRYKWTLNSSNKMLVSRVNRRVFAERGQHQIIREKYRNNIYKKESLSSNDREQKRDLHKKRNAPDLMIL